MTKPKKQYPSSGWVDAFQSSPALKEKIKALAVKRNMSKSKLIREMLENNLRIEADERLLVELIYRSRMLKVDRQDLVIAILKGWVANQVKKDEGATE